MPEFANALTGMKSDRPVTREELIRIVRFLVAAEYEAVQMYMQVVESTDNEAAKAVLRDVANEEVIHAGEFLRLLKELSPAEEKFYDMGAKEVDELLEDMRKTRV